MLSMFEAHKTKLKIELSRKASLQDLQDLEIRLKRAQDQEHVEARLSQIELKMREFEFTNDENEEEEIDSQNLDDIEVSVEKERRRNKSSSHSFKTDEGVPDVLNSVSRGSMAESVEPSMHTKSRGTLGSRRLQAIGGSRRQLMMLARDLSSANDKIDRLTLDFESATKNLEKVKADQENMITQYTTMKSVSASLKKEAYLMSQQNEQLKQVLEEASAKTKLMKEDVKAALEDFRAESSKHLSRLVFLESQQGGLKTEWLTFKKQLQKKFNESIGFMAKINERSEHLSKDVKGLKCTVGAAEAGSLQDIAALRRDIGLLKGPMHDYLIVKDKESEVLTEEVKRNQDLFRKLSEEYVAILENKPNTEQPKGSLQAEELLRLKKENAHLRTASASPAFSNPITGTSQSILRITNSNFNTRNHTKKADSSKSMSRPRSCVESLSNSYRETPRRIKPSSRKYTQDHAP